MRIFPFRARLPLLGEIPNTQIFFEKTREEYRAFDKKGYFGPLKELGIYVYKIEEEGKQFLGIIASVHIQDYLNGTIVGHEKTIEEVATKQAELLEDRQAMVKPILLTHPAIRPLDILLTQLISKRPPLLHYSGTGQKHSLWHVINSEDLTALLNLYNDNVPHVFIADGHHRAEAGVRAARSNPAYGMVLAALFSDDQLIVKSFHRIISSKDPTFLNTIMHRLNEWGELERINQPLLPDKPNNIGIYYHYDWYRLRWRNSFLSANAHLPAILDAWLLDEKVLKVLLGPCFQEDIEYLESTKGLDAIIAKVDKKQNAIAFTLPPINITDMYQMVLKDHIMPAKSTWFEPRMKNGWVVMPYSG